jgi:hypothetical protein
MFKENLTIRDLYEIAKEKGWLDKKIEIQFRDGGGDYPGTDNLIYLEETENSIIL